MTRHAASLAALLVLAGCATGPRAAAPVDISALEAQVRATETAFARTMADRDHAAFVSFLDADTIFVNGTRPLRGRDAVAAEWKKYFTGDVPFSWRPETVVVLADGTLAQSKGPVFDPAGRQIAEFRSTWRQVSPGVWKIVFDDGACACPKAP